MATTTRKRKAEERRMRDAHLATIQEALEEAEHQLDDVVLTLHRGRAAAAEEHLIVTAPRMQALITRAEELADAIERARMHVEGLRD